MTALSDVATKRAKVPVNNLLYNSVTCPQKPLSGLYTQNCIINPAKQGGIRMGGTGKTICDFRQ